MARNIIRTDSLCDLFKKHVSLDTNVDENVIRTILSKHGINILAENSGPFAFFKYGFSADVAFYYTEITNDYCDHNIRCS